MRFSSRIGRIQPSPTLAITSKAKALIASGVDVVSFGAGEPDFNTPEPAIEGAKLALDQGKTKYTAAAGIQELRAAIAKDYARRGRDVSASQVIVSPGGKFALFNAFQVLFDERDRVLIPTPFWVSYPAQVKLAGAQEVFAACDASTDFKLSPDALTEHLEGDASITGLVLCSPSNPTGEVYSEDELRALAKVLSKHPHVRVFFDAMYDRLYYDGDIAPDLLAVAPELGDRVLTFNGFSKTFAMTGWRLGYTIASEEIVGAMNKLQSQSTSNPTTFAQYGALSALELDDAVIAEMRDTFKRRRDLIVRALNAIEGVECRTPKGAFYAFPDFNAYIGSGKAFEDDLAFATALLDDAKVAVVPGSAFGAPGHVRLSYATSDALITKGVQRIGEYVKSL